MKKVLITTTLPENEVNTLREFFEVEVMPNLPHEDLLRVIADKEILLIRSETKVTKEVIDAAKKLEIIGRAGVGLDNVDVKEAEKKGIKVLNTPNANSTAVAELVFGIILTASRKLREADSTMKEDKWDKSTLCGSELSGKTIGIIGLGKIGRIVSRIAKAFEMKVIGYDSFLPEEEFRKMEVTKANNIEELLKNSDIVTLHIPKTAETTDLINEQNLKLMKKNSIIINCSRGGIVNEEALYQALNNKQIAGAGIDTWEEEPRAHQGLKKLQNVIALPHIGASTLEAQNKCATDLINQLFTIYGHK